MECRIQSDTQRADAIFPPLSPLYLIILLGTATRVLLPKEQQHGRLLSPYLASASSSLCKLFSPPSSSCGTTLPPQVSLGAAALSPWQDNGVQTVIY